MARSDDPAAIPRQAMDGKRVISCGSLCVEVSAAQAHGLSLHGVEILRGLSAPMRDRNWATIGVVIDEEAAGRGQYISRFSEPNGMFRGEFGLSLESDHRCTATFTLHIADNLELNRAGFCLLHPLRGVAGSPMTIRHSDGSEEQTRFPMAISPGQPALDMVGLIHQIGPIEVRILLEGEVFEMEDQRNWSDASFKTYCRPLSRPYPFAVKAGQVIKQRIVVELSERSLPMGNEIATTERDVILPEVLLAFEPDLASFRGLEHFPAVPVLARIRPDTSLRILEQLARIPAVALELVFSQLAEIDEIAERCHSVGLAPTRIVALPEPYLLSHQPAGPWPTGPTPDGGLSAVRRAFPGVPVGGGSLTNFTEFNRCPPSGEVDFLTFGNTAIVHAADDRSVVQTLEALPDIFASARQLRPDKPLHLGLFSIGMRTNPYGADVQPNPSGQPTPMARFDRRQETAFAAAYAIGILAEAALADVDSIALAMPDGELGAAGHPLAEVILFARRHAGSKARVSVDAGRYTIHVNGREIFADFPSISIGAAFNHAASSAPPVYRIGELST